jgi:hypothetical protein
MTVEGLSAVINHSRAKGSAKLVLIALADNGGGPDGNSRRSLADLGRFAGISREAVRRAIGRLVALGEISAVLADEWVEYQVLVSCSRRCDGRTHLNRRRRSRAPDGPPP